MDQFESGGLQYRGRNRRFIMPDPVKDTIQAALMAASEPLSTEDLRKLFPAIDRPDRQQIMAAIQSLESECEERSFSLVKVASGWRYQVDQDYAAAIGRMWEQRPPRYSQALLETLALIAYRQPITRGEIEQVRGVAPSTNIMQTLTERGWVRMVGHKQTPGHPALYGTTREFLNYFSLRSLKELPPLPAAREFPEQPPPENVLEAQAEGTGESEVQGVEDSDATRETRIDSP